MSDFSLIPQSLGGWLGWATAVILGVATAITQIKKVRVDETAAATHMWEALTTAHTAQIKALTERVASLESDMIAMRKVHAAEIAELKLTHAEELKHRDQDITSLQRIIAQNSQSVAQRMGGPSREEWDEATPVERAVRVAKSNRKKPEEEE